MDAITPTRLGRGFYTRDVLEVAPDLLGKLVILADSEGKELRYRITETEAYRGEEDRACHASKGRTSRTEIMFHAGGSIYVYLIYGMYWMFNVVSSEAGIPQAVLIRALEGYPGPGKLSRALGIDGSLYGIDLVSSDRIWIGDDGNIPAYITAPRIGIEYAASPWKEKDWRYLVKNEG